MSPETFGPLVAAAIGLAAYALLVRRRASSRSTPWPRGRSLAALLAALGFVAVLEPPLDPAAERAFTPHMLQHLVLTDVVAPLVLLSAPVALLLGALSPSAGRRVTGWLRLPVIRVLTFPAVTWSIFIGTLWLWHTGPLFDLSLASEPLHVVEHAVYLGTAVLFWLPVIAIPPAPWSELPLGYPMRMLYVILAMPAEAFLGFAIDEAPRVLYPHYRAAGLADQQQAGELMWVGSGLVMFVAFMLLGAEWGRAERRLGIQEDRRLDRERERSGDAGVSARRDAVRRPSSR